MKKEENNNNKVKIKKLKISKLYYEMNPFYDPQIKLKIAENLFLNNCIKNNFSLKEKNTDKGSFKKYNLRDIKYVHDFAIGKRPLNELNLNIKQKKINIQQNNINNLLITSLKSPRYSYKFIQLKINDNKNNYDDNNQFEKIMTNKKTYINKFKSNFSSENFENKLLKQTLNKNNIHMNLLENNFNYDLNKNMLNDKSYINYDSTKYYRSNMILHKKTKKYIIPSFECNKSKELKDLYSLKQFEMKEIEERMKLKPFIYK